MVDHFHEEAIMEALYIICRSKPLMVQVQYSEILHTSQLIKKESEYKVSHDTVAVEH